MKIRIGSQSGKGNGDTLWGGIAVCLFTAVWSVGIIRQGGLNFGAIAAMAMFGIVGIALVTMGVMKRRGTYDKTKIKDLAPKVIVTAFGACMAGIGVWFDIGLVREALSGEHHGCGLALTGNLTLATVIAVVGGLCFVTGMRGLFARRRNVVRDQQSAKAYLDYELKRVMSQKVRGTLIFAIIVNVANFIFALISWSQTRSAWSLVPLVPFVGVGIFLAWRAHALLARHRSHICHRARFSTMALYPGGEVSVSYEAVAGTSGGKMCAAVTQLDTSIREMRENEPTDVTADKSVKQIVAKQLAYERGQFSFRLPKALYAERIRWEIVLRFNRADGTFAEEHFKLPLT